MTAPFNPKQIISIPIEFRHRFEADPVTAWQSFGDTPQESEFPYFTNRAAVYNVVDRSRLNPLDERGNLSSSFYCRDDYYRFIHVDLGWKHDSCGIAMCHVEDWVTVHVDKTKEESGDSYISSDLRPIFDVDLLIRLTPENGEVIFEDVRRFIYELDARGFPLLLITFDRFQSVDTMQILKRGSEHTPSFIVSNLSLDRTSTYPVVDSSKPENIRKESTGTGKYSSLAAWSHCLSAVNTGRLRCPVYQPVTSTEVYHYDELVRNIDDFGNKLQTSEMITQLEQEMLGATFDSKALRVRESPKGSIDLLEAVAGCIFNANNNVAAPEATEFEFQRRRRLIKQLSNAETIFEKKDAEKQIIADPIMGAEAPDPDERFVRREEGLSPEEDDNTGDSFDGQGFFY